LQAAGGTIWTEHSPSVTVGEEGQLATKTGKKGWSTVFGGQQLTAGVYYMEVEVEGNMDDLLVGIARPGLDTADEKQYYAKDCVDAWFMNANAGTLCGNGKYGDDKAGRFKAGDRIGLLLDLDNHSLLFFKNGEKHGPGYGASSKWLQQVAGSVTGPVVLAMHMYWEGSSGRVVAGAVRPSGYQWPEAVSGAAGKEEQSAPSTVETVRARTVFVACAGAVVVVCALWLHCLLIHHRCFLLGCCSYTAATVLCSSTTYYTSLRSLYIGYK
jgi:hypothetical protein